MMELMTLGVGERRVDCLELYIYNTIAHESSSSERYPFDRSSIMKSSTIHQLMSKNIILTSMKIKRTSNRLAETNQENVLKYMIHPNISLCATYLIEVVDVEMVDYKRDDDRGQEPRQIRDQMVGFEECGYLRAHSAHRPSRLWGSVVKWPGEYRGGRFVEHLARGAGECCGHIAPQTAPEPAGEVEVVVLH
jgi:hypothetical protein